jgi:aspartate kinase
VLGKLDFKKAPANNARMSGDWHEQRARGQHIGGDEVRRDLGGGCEGDAAHGGDRARAARAGLNAVVVVSAMAKVTDLLLAAAAAAGAATRRARWRLRRGCATRHIDTAPSCCAGERSPRCSSTAITREFDALDDLLRGIAAVGELTPRTSDLVVSFGERLSQMVAAAFEQHGLNGAHVDARTVHHHRRPLRQGRAAGGAIEAKLTELVLPLLDRARRR